MIGKFNATIMDWKMVDGQLSINQNNQALSSPPYSLAAVIPNSPISPSFFQKLFLSAKSSALSILQKYYHLSTVQGIEIAKF